MTNTLSEAGGEKLIKLCLSRQWIAIKENGTIIS